MATAPAAALEPLRSIPSAGDVPLAMSALLALPSGQEAAEKLRALGEGAGFAHLQRLVLLGCLGQQLRVLQAAGSSGPGGSGVGQACELMQLMHESLAALKARVGALGQGLSSELRAELAVVQELEGWLATAADARWAALLRCIQCMCHATHRNAAVPVHTVCMRIASWHRPQAAEVLHPQPTAAQPMLLVPY
jgi:hypothetical protein